MIWGFVMPTSSPTPPKVHRLGIVFTATGPRFLCCKDCPLSIEIAEGSDASLYAAKTKAKTIPCTKSPNAFSSDWGNRKAGLPTGSG
jgi:hypothetical protein